MVPYRLDEHGPEERYYFLVERPGLDIVRLGDGEANLF